MGSLIDDLLTLARRGQVVSGMETIELTLVVRQAWSSVETRESTLVVDSLGTVKADRGRLQELFENLFRNAIEHAGTATTVRVGRLDDGLESDATEDPTDDTVGGFYVEDDDPGIPPEEREAVFEYGHTTADDGSGIGLSIVDGIAEAHSWSVSVCDGRDGGARFQIRRE